MTKRLLIAFAAIAFALVGIAASWAACHQKVRLLQGKTEREWIASINGYTGSLAEIEQWRALGQDGTRMLVKVLNYGNDPVGSRYVKIWPKLPPFAQRHLPTPAEYQISTRLRAAKLLNEIGPEKSAVPALIRVLKAEKQDGVRTTIIACFDFQKGLLEGMNKEKLELLPVLFTDLRTRGTGPWINVVLALGSYSEQPNLVTPVLLKELRDCPTNSIRRQTAALLALNHVAPGALATPEVMQMLVHIISEQEKDNPVALQGLGRLLAKLGANASSAVPALIKRATENDRQIAEEIASKPPQ